MQHCLCPLAYTWAELHFQRYHNGPSDPKRIENITCIMVMYGDQPSHQHSLIRIFIVRTKKLCNIGYPKCVQWRFSSELHEYADWSKSSLGARLGRCVYWRSSSIYMMDLRYKYLRHYVYFVQLQNLFNGNTSGRTESNFRSLADEINRNTGKEP